MGSTPSSKAQVVINVLLTLATIALAIFSYYSWETSKAILRPYLNMDGILSMDQPVTTLILANDGTSPGIIKWTEVWVDEIRPESPGQRNGWAEIWPTVPNAGHPQNEYSYFGSGEILAAGTRKTLIGLHNEDVTKPIYRDRNVAFMGKLTFYSCYCSLSDACWVFRFKLPDQRSTVRVENCRNVSAPEVERAARQGWEDLRL